MMRYREFSDVEEREQMAQESLRDALLGVCIEGDEDAPCRRCVHCRAVLRDWDEAAVAHEEARVEAYRAACGGAW